MTHSRSAESRLSAVNWGRDRTVVTISAGTRLGGYEIRSKIGEGGMGEVYRARDTKLGRDVAIKVLPAAFSADSYRRFSHED